MTPVSCEDPLNNQMYTSYTHHLNPQKRKIHTHEHFAWPWTKFQCNWFIQITLAGNADQKNAKNEGSCSLIWNLLHIGSLFTFWKSWESEQKLKEVALK